MEQLAFFAIRPRKPREKPKPVRVRLRACDLEHGKRITIRLGIAEARQLLAVCRREEATASDLVREGLYRSWGIGELEER